MKQVQYPKRRAATAKRPWWLLLAAASGLVVLIAAVVVLQQGGKTESAAAGLPETPDYHSLLVSPGNPQELILGTHNGLHASSDGGRTWRFSALSGNDAMNLARPAGDTLWLAGHGVFKKSSDAGATWQDVQPSGLPGLDIHGFAVDPMSPKTLYAAIAGRGLYRSIDAGGSFSLVSGEVGGGVFGLAVLPGGRLLAADGKRGILASDDRGGHWREALAAPAVGLAVNPQDPTRVLATGRGILLSTDSGASWRSVLKLPDGAGPVAWAPSDPQVAYVVSFDRRLLRTDDGGASWEAVS